MKEDKVLERILERKSFFVHERYYWSRRYEHIEKLKQKSKTDNEQLLNETKNNPTQLKFNFD